MFQRYTDTSGHTFYINAGNPRITPTTGALEFPPILSIAECNLPEAQLDKDLQRCVYLRPMGLCESVQCKKKRYNASEYCRVHVQPWFRVQKIELPPLSG